MDYKKKYLKYKKKYLNLQRDMIGGLEKNLEEGYDVNNLSTKNYNFDYKNTDNKKYDKYHSLLEVIKSMSTDTDLTTQDLINNNLHLYNKIISDNSKLPLEKLWRIPKTKQMIIVNI